MTKHVTSTRNDFLQASHTQIGRDGAKLLDIVAHLEQENEQLRRQVEALSKN